jgi:hypothetical protein
VALVFGPPVLADDDPVVQQVLRTCGVTLNGGAVVGGGGLSLADIKVFLTDRREEVDDGVLDATEEGEVFTDVRWWGADAVLHDGVSPYALSVALPAEGYWRLADPPNIDTIVYIHGYTYDTNLAASDVLEAWADHLKLEFDFSDGSGSYQRSQKIANLLEMADRFRRRGRVTNTELTRRDMYPQTHNWLPVNEQWGP